MKRIVLLAYTMKLHLWLGLLALFVCPTACRNNHPATFPVGAWYTRDDQVGIFGQLNFYENGHFDGVVDYQNKRIANCEGTWEFKDKILYYTYSKGPQVKLFKDGKDYDTILEITDTYYTFKTAQGELHRYDRFRPGQPTPPNQPK